MNDMEGLWLGGEIRNPKLQPTPSRGDSPRKLERVRFATDL